MFCFSNVPSEAQQGEEITIECNESADTDSDEIVSSVPTIEELSDQNSATEALKEVVKHLSEAIEECQNSERGSLEDAVVEDNESTKIQDTGISLTYVSENVFTNNKTNNSSLFDTVTVPADQLIINTVLMDTSNQFKGTDKVTNIMEIIDSGESETKYFNSLYKIDESDLTKPSAPPAEILNENASSTGGSVSLRMDSTHSTKQEPIKQPNKKSLWNDFLRKIFKKKKVETTN